MTENTENTENLQAEETDNQNPENVSAEDTGGNQNDQPVEMEWDNVLPLDENGFRGRLMVDLFNKPEDSAEREWLNEELVRYIDEGKLKPDEVLTEEHPVSEALYNDYLEGLCYNFKTDAFALDADKVNIAIEKLQKMALITFPNDITTSKMDKAIIHRFSRIPPLADAYEVMAAGRDIFNMINSTSSSMATQIEVENKVQHLEDLYEYNVIDEEQMAFGYHNIAILMERLSQQKTEKNNEPLAKQAYDYMSKALRLTSNPKLIKTCFEYLPVNMSKKTLFVLEACDRALEKNKDDASSRYKLHMMYSKAIETEIKKLHLGLLPEDDYNMAVYHYREALNDTSSKDLKIKTMRGLIKLQQSKKTKDAYFSHMELAEKYLEGKIKVRELMKLALETKNPQLQQVLYESAANELIDSNGLKKEEKSLLLSNVIGKLRPLYGNDKEKLDGLNSLEKEYCQKQEKKEFLFARNSSKGNDYFQ
ncbi:MAG: hypothetical protein Q4D80_04785 [Pseudomonadota bacterium]|nr:hypothetical protein [Pseudomonadota bacterium]